MVPEPSVADILVEQAQPDRACQALVDAANAAGGRDNVSVIVVDVDGLPGPGPGR
jgi:protein phosphatase